MKRVVASLMVWAAFAAVVTAGSREEAVMDALKASREWLVLCDAGDYRECWEQTATYFQGAVSKEQLNQSLSAVRKPLGSMQQRDFTSATYATSMPGSPDGEYVVFTFESSFAKKKNAVETVTMMMDGDRGWRLSGYYIK